jgi:hypothetical protein
MQRTIPSPDLSQIHIESFSCSSRQDMIKELWCVSGPALLHITAGTSEKARTLGSSSTRHLLKEISQSPRTVAGRLQELYNPKIEVIQKASAEDLRSGPQSRESAITRYVPIAYVTPQRALTTHHSHHFHDVKAMTRLCKPRPVLQPRAVSGCSMWAAVRRVLVEQREYLLQVVDSVHPDQAHLELLPRC